MINFIYRFFLLISFCTLVGITSTKAQGGFNVINSTANGIEGPLNIDDILFLNDQLYVRGNIFIDSLGIWGLFIASIDTNSTVLWHKTIFDSTLQYNWVANSPTRFYLADDGEIVIPNYFYESNQLALTVLDSNGTELFTKSFTHDGFTIFPRNVKKIDNNYYLFGTVQRQDYKLDNYILKCDSSGNQIWIKYFGKVDQNEGFGDVIQNGDNTFSVSSFRTSKEFYLSGSELIGWKSPWAFRVDTSGAIIEEWIGKENDTTTLGGGPFIKFPNGDFSFASKDLKVFPYLTSYEVWGSPTVTRLDSNFNLVWKRNILDFQNLWDAIIDMEYDSSRDEIVVLGHKIVQYSESYSKREVWLVKLSGEGDILWNISDTIYADPYAVHEPSGLEISPAGTIYSAGSVRFNDLHQAWILKVTADGCSDTLCTTTSIEEQIKHWNKNVILYPNPTDDKLHIRIHDLDGFADLQMYDLHGRVLIRERIQEGENSIKLNLPSGIYICTIVNDGKLEYSGKIVVK